MPEEKTEENFDYLVGGWRFIPALNQLKNDTESVKLEPRVTELLLHLLKEPGMPVGRDQLMQAVWTNMVVSDEALSNAINKLRKALGDDSHSPSYIETIPKKGYRLIAPVEISKNEENQKSIKELKPSVENVEVALPRKRPYWFVFIVALLLFSSVAVLNLFQPKQQTNPSVEVAAITDSALSPEISSGSSKSNPTIAVLPFVNMSGESEQEYFSDGLAEDLLTDLSKISALTVISRSSSFAYRDNNPDIRIIGKELGVSHVIEGSVRKAANRLRISAQLIDAANGQTIWAERYDRKLEDIFSLQDEVRSNIISALKIKLVVAEVQRISRRGTDFIEAYDLLMKGRYKEISFTPEDNAEAIRIYQKVLEIDPNYSMAYARLANMLQIRSLFGWSENFDADQKNAIRFAEKAIALEPDNPFAHWTHGRISMLIKTGGIKNLFNGIVSLEKAIELDPNYADAYGFISQFFLAIGKSDEALSAIEKAMELNPQYPFWYIRNRGFIMYMNGDYDSAIVDLETALGKNPSGRLIRWWLVAALAQAGLNDEAEWQAEELSMMIGLDPTIQRLLDRTIIHHQPYVDKLIEGLRKAGLPEE